MRNLLNRRVKVNGHLGKVVGQDFTMATYVVEFDNKNLIPPEMDVGMSLIDNYLLPEFNSYFNKCECGAESALGHQCSPYSHGTFCPKFKRREEEDA